MAAEEVQTLVLVQEEEDQTAVIQEAALEEETQIQEEEDQVAEAQEAAQEVEIPEEDQVIPATLEEAEILVQEDKALLQ